jgi:hypothetical protein
VCDRLRVAVRFAVVFPAAHGIDLENDQDDNAICLRLPAHHLTL